MDKDTEEQNKLLEQNNKLLRENEKLRSQLDKAADDRRKNVKKDYQGAKNASSALNSMLKDLNGHTQNLYATTSDYFRAWVSFKSFTSISGMVRDLVSSNNQFHRLIVNAGSANISLANASKEVNKLQQRLGASFEDAQNVVGTLASKQYVGNLGEAAQGAYSFARSTGLATDSVASLTVEFQKTGKLGSSAINSIYADMLKVQQSNGMTKEGMQTTANQIIKMTGNMRAFGKTEQEIRKMAAGTTQLVSSLEKVGISAQTATAWIDKLTDPERIEENIGLYSQLGISISDALSGNINEAQMQNGLKDFGEKVKSMGPIAGAAYAKAFGMTFNNVVKASDMEGAVEEQLTPQEKALDAIKELTENTKTQSEKMTDYVNKLTGRLMNLGPVMLTIGGILVNMLGSSLRRAIIDGISGGANEGYKEAEKSSKSAVQRMKEDVKGAFKDAEDIAKNETKYDNIRKNAAEQKLKSLREYRKEVESSWIKDAKNALIEKTDIEEKHKAAMDAVTAVEKKIKETQKELQSGVLSKSDPDADSAQKKLEGYQKQLQSLNEYSKSLGAQENDAAKKYGQIIDDMREVGLWSREMAKGIGVEAEKLEKEFPKFKEDSFKWGENVGSSIRKGVKDIGSGIGTWIANSSVGKIGRGIGNFIGGAVKKTAGGIGKVIKGAGGIVAGLFKKNIKEGAEEGNKKSKGGGGFGKLALVGGLLISVITPIIAALKEQEGVKRIIETFQNMIKNVAEKLTPVIEKIAPVGEMLINVLGGVIENIATALVSSLDSITPLIETIGSVMSTIMTSLGEVLKACLPIIAELLNILIIPLQLLATLIKYVVAPVLKVIAWLLKLILKPIEWLAKLFTGKSLDKNTAALNDNSAALKEKEEGEKIYIGKNGEAMTSGLSGGGTTTATTTSTSSSGASMTNSTTSTSSTYSSSNNLSDGLSKLNSKLDVLISTIKNNSSNDKIAGIGNSFSRSLENFEGRIRARPIPVLTGAGATVGTAVHMTGDGLIENMESGTTTSSDVKG